MKKLITAESVTEGHPDKVCDQISDAILDDLLKQDPYSRVAVETMVTNGLIIVAGEVTTKGECEINRVVKRVLTKIGYNPDDFGILNTIHSQSKDISQGVDTGGAGDQGMMIGYATNETREYMPLPIYLAHKLTKRLSGVRKNKTVGYLKPDGKSQVTVAYENNEATQVDTVVISSQHESIDDNYYEFLKEAIVTNVINVVIPQCLRLSNITIFINPTGKFEIGGPVADTGLTGRKIIVDTYGGMVGHGGGAFSGKDPTKVDRSGAYMARHIAKSIVASKYARRCFVQIAYAIGIAEPVSIFVKTDLGGLNDENLIDIIKKNFDLRPQAIIEYLDLRKPIYEETASYGHFGRDEFPWEKIKEL